MQVNQFDDKLLTVAQVAEMLGMKEATIRNWIWTRSISYVKLKNRSIRIKLGVVQALIAEGEIPARRK
jgi:excisionase family DNA binding protein